MSWRMRAVAITAGLALTVTGCSGGAVRKAASGPTRPFVYSYNLNVVTDWDPATSYSNEIIAMQNIYESLTRYDAATKSVRPLLATRWTSAPDGRTWTFTLRDGVRFHDGNALTSAVAKASIERTIKLAGGAAYIWDAVKTIDTPDPRTLVFRLKYAAPLDLISASDYGAYIYDTTAPGGGGLKAYLDKGHDTGTGPYTVASWNKGQETELRLGQVKDYWGGWSGSHYTSVEFRDTPQVTTAWQQLRTGDVSFVGRLNPQLFAQAKGVRGLKTQATPSFQNLIAFFNTASGPLQDVTVRKAVQAAIDYDGMVAALKGSVTAASGVVPNGLIGATPGLEAHQNTAEAARLLNQAGYGPGKKQLTLSLTYAQGDDDQQTFVTLLSSALKGLNVTLRAKPMQWDAQWSQGKSGDPGKRQDIFVMYWYPDYPDAFGWFKNLFHSARPVSFNLTYLDDSGVDAAIERLPRLVATDRPQAQAAYAALQRTLLVDKAVAAPLYVQQYQRAYAGGIGGYTDNPAYPNVVFVHDLRPTG
ncbi:ABC transporter substrate-binding protein [Actinoallomurus vinaceus]|uniref:ABC transporter substrate-binding protein n=1 Tax=Actinoallomurus vinaceus TaxID=1080074 RepID=A0ABP8UF75_9ACTN